MSRFTVPDVVMVLDDADITVEISYGYDTFCGYFIQVISDTGDILLDKDTFSDRLTGVELSEQLDEIGVPVPSLRHAAMMLDMPL